MKLQNNIFFANLLKTDPTILAQKGLAVAFKALSEAGQVPHLSIEHCQAGGFYAYYGILENSKGERNFTVMVGTQTCHGSVTDALNAINGSTIFAKEYPPLKNIEKTLQSGSVLSVHKIGGELSFWLPTLNQSIVTNSSTVINFSETTFNETLKKTFADINDVAGYLLGQGKRTVARRS